MKLEVSKIPLFKPTSSIIMVQRVLQWRGKRGFLAANVKGHGKKMPF